MQQSRPLLEWHIQQFIVDTPNIGFEYESEVKGYLHDKSPRKITGVSVHNKQSGKEEENLLILL
ncbi:hypothetical protein [Cytobacillus purgationiresistens]|uniref:Uncharacterized protein n=1 Tax=Cytobacillus purgationiresistens TaxID=863449 RepID=A0ABU0AG96_9BACI|nr:hypothetical protein [Cytobacillus purgationiresistens]MDQ0270282.1 hypothetical protein [Cytobacillus purgationiresistens]